jgi:nucleoside-diphosphate-sugar epimerase
MEKKILVTGGAGHIGGALCRKLVTEKNTHVTILDDLSTGSKNKLPSKEFSNYDFIQVDVNNAHFLKEQIFGKNFDYVFHYAAVVGVQRTLEDPESVLNDIQGLKNILEICKETKVKRIFFSSSSEVYGEPVSIPQKEDETPLNSKLPYAVVKNVSEAYLRTYKQMYGLDYTIFRFFNTYGPLQSEDFVITKFIRQCLNNEDLQINGDGSQTRTFCYIDDSIQALINCMNKNFYVNDVLNIGNEYEITILDLAKLVIKLTGSNSKIIHRDPLKEGDMTRRKPDIEKMKIVLNRELLSLDDGIKKVCEFLK